MFSTIHANFRVCLEPSVEQWKWTILLAEHIAEKMLGWRQESLVSRLMSLSAFQVQNGP